MAVKKLYDIGASLLEAELTILNPEICSKFFNQVSILQYFLRSQFTNSHDWQVLVSSKPFQHNLMFGSKTNFHSSEALLKCSTLG
jgi:hypothetical protein